MINHIQSIRGMNDHLPKEIEFWQHVEKILKRILISYDYTEIRLPIVEQASLFQKAIGEITELAEKEMYIFADRNGKNLTLRPEGTAGCIRAGIEHGLLCNQEQRWWYLGPMFRYERPQKGRYRQFYQLGVEAFGQKGPDIDAELILLTARWWRALGINKYVTLELNSNGSLETRIRYCKALITFLNQNKDKLDEDCRRRMYVNPMRVLDTKNSNIKKILDDAPILTDYLDDESRNHFSNLCKLLDVAGILYTVNPRLVRGLDYYNKTIFEWVTTNLGSQSAICGGGRYDELVKQLGGSSTPAIGLAVGLDRLLLLMQMVNIDFFNASHLDAYLVYRDGMQNEAFRLTEQLRDILPSLRIRINFGGGSFKKQFSRANKHGSRIVLVLGENEVALGTIIIKDLITGKQETLLQKNIPAKLASILKLNMQNFF